MVPSPPEVIQRFGLLEMIVLRGPHLMLADLGGDVGVQVLGQPIEPLDGILRHDHVVVRPVGERIRAPASARSAPTTDRAPSCRPSAAGPPQPHQIFQHAADIAENADVGAHVLVDRRRVDIDVDLLGVRREGVEPAGDAVVEARADAEHHVAIMHGHIGFVGAVHAEHAQPVLAGRRIGAEAHQRRGDRKAGEIDQFAQQMAGLRARN